MSERSSITHKIQWHDGMALLPHHFQQLDLRMSQVIAHNMSIVSRYHWGIQDLVIDAIALPDGTFRVKNAEVVMPDGLIFHYTSSDRMLPILEIDLQPYKPASNREVITVWLVLPAYLDGTSPICAATPRFKSVDGPSVVDENTDDNPVDIPRLIPCFSLCVGEATPANHVGFPLAKVKFTEGAFVLIDFTPPCFQLSEKSHLWNICIDMTRKIREKALALSEKWQNQLGTSLLRETSEMLKPLVAMLPTLEALVAGKDVAPFELYDELMESAGFVAQLNLSSVPPRFDKYDHNNADNCILPILNYIIQCIDHLSLEYAIFSFKKNDRVFSFKLNAAYCLSSKEIFVGVRAKPGIQTKQVEDWMEEAVIASDDALRKVQNMRVTGAARKLITGEQLYEMSPPRDITLFTVTLDPQFITPNQYLHIFNPSDTEHYRPVDIVLYVPKDEKSSAREAA
ncbi:MAG: type VI secretion system baseplate subunit TssK [Holosporales bacterium]|jgi:type VI secretion system protein ImpJ|nr:type VI secretion system baseplate subunit TssK [Holosporales bacterium]